MQKLSGELNNVSTDAPLVCSSTSFGLNKVERPSDQNKVLTDNNLEVDLLQHTGGRVSILVCVISSKGKVLMPCTSTKARKLLHDRKAKCIRRYPFTIKLLFDTSENVQELTFGMDVGYSHVGFSVVGVKKEVVCGTLELDGQTSSRLKDRSMYRNNRRYHLWYRKCRFNRKVEEGWIPPSVERRYNTHLALLKLYSKLLPISRVIIETASFDIQKINNPDIEGKEYQQGNLYGYQNVRSFLFAREQGKCQYCGKEFTKTDSSHIHHIISRSTGGTDKPNNLALLHETCHKRLHKKKDFSWLKKNKQFKAETWMNIIRNKFQKDLENIEITFGYITNLIRNSIDLEKTHYNDAFVIAKGSDQARAKPITIIQKRKNNRCLQTNRNGYKPSIRRKRYAIRSGDLVKIIGNNKTFIVKGIHGYGTCVKVFDNGKVLNFNVNKIFKCYHQKTLTY